MEHQRAHSLQGTLFLQDTVHLRGGRWLPATVCSTRGPVIYGIFLKDGTKWRRHVDHFRRRTLDMQDFPSADASQSCTEVFSAPVEEDVSNEEVTPAALQPTGSTHQPPRIRSGPAAFVNDSDSPRASTSTRNSGEPRRSVPSRLPPAHLRNYKCTALDVETYTNSITSRTPVLAAVP